jgi:hypothetical protein
LTSVRFAWNPLADQLRREVCPNARWQKQQCQWLMPIEEAQQFLQAAQGRLEFVKQHEEIWVGNVVWVVGFAQGAPYRVAESF